VGWSLWSSSGSSSAVQASIASWTLLLRFVLSRIRLT
jgi:hypothetical protein